MKDSAECIQYPLWSFRFLKAYAVTMRPYLLFISGITGIAGMAFVTEISAVRALLVFIAAFLSYGFGQALTDAFQIDTDTLSAPYRPLTRGLLRESDVLRVSLAGLTFCVVIFAALNVRTLALGVIGGTGLATYTYFKRRWWGGPWYNAWIVTLLCFIAYLAGAGEGWLPVSRKFLCTLGTVFFGYMNFVLTGYFKDIEADRATGYLTLPVVFGRRISAFASDGTAVAMVTLAVLAIQDPPLIVLILFAVATLCIGVGQVRLHANRSDSEAHRAIVPGLHGYVLMLTGIAINQQPSWILPLLLFYSGFVAVLTLRPAENQV